MSRRMSDEQATGSIESTSQR